MAHGPVETQPLRSVYTGRVKLISILKQKILVLWCLARHNRHLGRTVFVDNRVYRRCRKCRSLRSQ